PGWNNSTHDVSTAIRETFPVDDPLGIGTPPDETGYDYDGLHTVGEYACRNCHDPHTVQGAKRLHREGVTAIGGSDAIENTCFLCHSSNTAQNPLLPLVDEVDVGVPPARDPQPVSFANPRFSPSGVGRIAPDIFSEFDKDSGTCAGGSQAGSGMCLQLATGHEPVFISRPQEGVQMKSEGLAGLEAPSANEELPGIGTVDPTHVECVDCHNPHQVNSPHLSSVAYNGISPNPPAGVGNADAQGEGGRLKGMKGVGIDSTGTRPVVVGKCEPGFVVCGTEATINAQHPSLAPQASANRDPYVYEICFRCHGMSYKRVFSQDGTGVPSLLNPDDVSSFTIADPNYVADPNITAFALRTDPTNG
ncbi:MAG TPA: cytochrome c3 family protein, partial [Nitrospiria bacterium]|nr:cytochrome c3 family protein [Nitrospiria bacterium]